MRNNISIDKLFHDGLSEGKEQLNLGAWANMERMLDGKNPYSSDGDEKKKRRILPLFGLLLLLTASISAGLLFRSHKAKKNIAQSTSAFSPQQEVSPSGSTAVPTSSEIPNKTSEEQAIAPATTKVNQPADGSSNTTPPSNTATNEKESRPTTARHQHSSSPSITTSLPSEEPIMNQEESMSQDTKASRKASKRIRNNSSIGSSTLNNKESKSNELRAHDRNPSGALQAENPSGNLADRSESKPMPKVIKQEVPRITINENVTNERNGQRKVNRDTMNREVEIREVVERTPIDHHQSNPRYVDLNTSDELLAQKQKEITIASNPPSEPVVHSSQNEVKSTSHKNSTKNSDLKEELTTISQKITDAARKITSKKLILYPGMSAGVNAALFNTQHNYGGFHLGVSNVTPINNYFSVLADLKLFYRSNSGYTVHDIQSVNKGHTMDTLSLHSEQKTIHYTQLDSSMRKYNFNHIFSLEIPLTLQYHMNKLSFFGGVNIVYNFGLNPTSVLTKTSIEHVDTLANSGVYIPPANQNYRYASSDFNSRFGFGYVFGTSYAFSPRLYLDLRLAQTQWDNARTLSAREISTGVFKVPYIQFSLGYRFKDFNPEQ